MQVGQPVGRYFIRRIALVGGPAGIVPRYNLAGRRDGGAGRGGAGGGRGRLTGRGAPCRIARGPGGYGGAVGWLVRLRVSRAGMGGRIRPPSVRPLLPAFLWTIRWRTVGRWRILPEGVWGRARNRKRRWNGGRKKGRKARFPGEDPFPSGKARQSASRRRPPRRLISRLYSSSEMLLLFIEIL